MTKCQVCFRHCELSEGAIGFCRARIGIGGEVRAANYGRITSLALDPIEKKPLRRFFPGTKILSVGSYGCNLRCPFCQNSEISWGEEAKEFSDTAETIDPEILAASMEGIETPVIKRKEISASHLPITSRWWDTSLSATRRNSPMRRG